MRKFFLFFLMTLYVSACDSFNIDYKNVGEYTGDVMEGKTNFFTGELTGEYKIANLDNPAFEFSEKQKKFFGMLFYYNEDTPDESKYLSVHEIGNYKQGKKHGEMRRYEFSSDISITANFKNGKLDGKYITYFGEDTTSPNLKSITYYNMGIAINHEIIYANGDIEKGLGRPYSGKYTYTWFLDKSIMEATYVNGKTNGPFTIKYSNGDLERGTYKDGKKSGKYYYQFKSGRTETGVYSYLTGKRISD